MGVKQYWIFLLVVFAIGVKAQKTNLLLLPDNRVFVTEVRTYNVEEGQQRLLIENLPNGIDFPGFFVWGTTPEVTVNAIGIESARMNQGVLFQRNLNKRIVVHLANGQQLTGRLIEWFDDGSRIYLQTNQGYPLYLELEEPFWISFVEDSIFFQSRDFYSRYYADITSNYTGSVQLGLGYLVNRFTWRVIYEGILNTEENELQLTGWLGLYNETGKPFKHARLHILVGKPQVYTSHMAWERQYDNYIRRLYDNREFNLIEEPQDFQIQELKDLKIYTLPRMISLPVGNTQKVAFFPALSAAVRKEYIAEVDGRIVVESRLKIENTKENNLGFTLPAGKWYFYKIVQGQRVFISSERMGVLPALDTLEMTLGEVTDIQVTHRLVKSESRSRDKLESAYEIQIKNLKSEPVEIQIRINDFRGKPLRIKKCAISPCQFRDGRVYLRVKVPAESRKTVSYVMEEKERDYY